MENIEIINWHDAELLDIKIDRKLAGEKDEIELTILLTDSEILSLIFKDCYYADFQMNFGIVASESISDFFVDIDDPRTSDIKKIWEKLDVTLDIRCYNLITNSTNSVLKIYCKELFITQFKH